MKQPARVYLDTNVFITAYETKGGPSQEAWWLLDQLERGAIGGFTSELTLAELLTGPLARKENDLADMYKVLISDGASLGVLPIHRSIMIKAAEVRAEARSLRLPDAIHIASALSLGCSIFVSNDRRLPRIDALRFFSLASDGFAQFRLMLE